MGLFDKIATLIGGATSTTAGGILTSITGAADDIFNTAGDKAKAAQFATAAQQAIQIELDKHNEAVQALAEQQYQAQIADIQNARDMQVKLNEASAAGWLPKNIPSVLAIGITSMWASVGIYIVLHAMNLIAANPNVNMTIILGMFTAITAAETMVLSFYFGSSSGSKSKDETIASIAKSN